MRKIFCACAMLLCGAMAATAQVDNYSLKLSNGGNVAFNQMPELNRLSSYTVQFWMNVDAWTNGATIYSCGNAFSAALGNAKQMTFKVGDKTLTVTSDDLVENVWNQITFIANGVSGRVLVNGKEAGSLAEEMVIPENEDIFVIGGNFAGRIDEFRVWNAELADKFDYFINNTLNKFNPQWENLVAYYKFDQNLCDNVVDYTFGKNIAGKMPHHGTFSETGAVRDVVTDNNNFKYMTAGAYTDFSRFFDRAIDKDKYLLVNDLIVLGIDSHSDGHLSLPYPECQGVLKNAEYLSEYKGRNGVLSLNGEGAGMEVGVNALTPTDAYTFFTWVYLEKWTEGAFLFRKETSDGKKGFSIRLGKESSTTPGCGSFVVRLNGYDYPSQALPIVKVGEWAHFAVRTYATDMTYEKTFEFIFNDKSFFCSKGQMTGEEPIAWAPEGVENVAAVVGENLDAKLDNTTIWHASLDRFRMQGFMQNGLPMPGFDIVLTAGDQMKANSCWMYDNAENPGYDSYSYKSYLNIMRSAYENHRGYKIRMSVHGHDGWENTFANADKRKIFAADLAEIAKEFDGVDLDFEWCYSQTCWDNYGKLLEEIEKVLDKDKILTVSPHKVSYSLRPQYMEPVDYFTFQIYGPSKDLFNYPAYTDAYNRFANQGYPNEKMLLSYATTTSRGWKDGKEVAAAAPIGVRNGLVDGDYTPDMDSAVDAQGYTRYFTGAQQTYDRSKFARDKGLRGVFYWDMGNDVKTNHQYSIPRWSSYAINSNVDTLVTKVDMTPGRVTAVAKQSEKKLVIKPNPVAEENVAFSLSDGEEIYRIRLYDMDGKCVLNGGEYEDVFNLSDLKSGVYAVTAQTVSGKNTHSKLMKK